MKPHLSVLHLDANDNNQSEATLLMVENGVQVSIKLSDIVRLVKASHGEEILHEVLAGSTGSADVPRDAITTEGIELWLRHNWLPSICHHSVASGIQGSDSTDHSMRIRKEVLRQYETEGPIPPRYTCASPELSLPQPTQVNNESLMGALETRRTIRGFRKFNLPLQVISNVLWNGLRVIRETRQAAVSHPLGPLHSFGVGCEIFFAVHSASGIQEGAYHYDVENHSVSLVRSLVSRRWVWKVLNYQSAPLTASISIFLVLDFAQVQWRYRHEKALTNQFMDVGRVAQRIILAGERLGLGSFITPALMDSQVRRIFRLDLERFYPVHAVCLGLKPGG